MWESAGLIHLLRAYEIIKRDELFEGIKRVGIVNKIA